MPQSPRTKKVRWSELQVVSEKEYDAAEVTQANPARKSVTVERIRRRRVQSDSSWIQFPVQSLVGSSSRRPSSARCRTSEGAAGSVELDFSSITGSWGLKKDPDRLDVYRSKLR